jgi:hypothetical protein
MTDFLIAFMAIATVVLGVLAYHKFQRATGGGPDTDKIGKKGSSPLPRELRELKIDPPGENMLDHPEEPKRTSRGQQGPSGHSAT